MKTIIAVLIVILFACSAHGQDDLPTISAKGGSSKLVDWPKLKKEEAAAENSPGFFYRDCAQGVGSPKASSTLAPQGSKSYLASNLNDDDPMSAWVEGKPGYGIGEWFGVSAPTVNSIFNGYQATPTTWKNNSRVKKLKVLMDNEELCFLILEDKMDEQTFDLPMEVDWNKSHEFKFVILEVYKGLKYDDVAISHVDFVGCCVAEGTLIDETPIEEILSGAEIMTVDPASGTVGKASVIKISVATHANLLEVKTDSHTLLLTPDHLLFVSGEGFRSLSSIKKGRKAEAYAELTGHVEVMTWNENNHRMEYEMIRSIKPVSGSFKTFAVRGLSSGIAYLANGLVTTTY